jgi:hypothetical protein
VRKQSVEGKNSFSTRCWCGLTGCLTHGVHPTKTFFVRLRGLCVRGETAFTTHQHTITPQHNSPSITSRCAC